MRMIVFAATKKNLLHQIFTKLQVISLYATTVIINKYSSNWPLSMEAHLIIYLKISSGFTAKRYEAIGWCLRKYVAHTEVSMKSTKSFD